MADTIHVKHGFFDFFFPLFLKIGDMSRIPEYFYRLFESVQRLEKYLSISIDNLNIPTEQKRQLRDLSKEILIVKTHDHVRYSEGTEWKESNDTQGSANTVKCEEGIMITNYNKDLDLNKVKCI